MAQTAHSADLNTLSQELGMQLTPSDLKSINELVALQAQMADELIARFARNIAAFEDFMPEIAAAFRNYRPTKSLEFFCAPGGAPNLMWVEDKRIFYNALDPNALCRRQIELLLQNQSFYQVRYSNEYDPFGQIHHRYMNEAVNVLKDYQLKADTPLLSGSVPCCMIFGLGLGYVLEHLYSRIEVANLIVIEPDNDLFFAALHTFEWGPLLQFLKENHYALYLLIGADKEHIAEDLEKFYLKHGRFIAGFFWNFVHYRSKEIDELTQAVLKDYSRPYAAMGFFDDHLFGISHGVHVLEHKARLALREGKLPGRSADEVPIFVVANGPSLTHDLPFLRRFQDKALILSCGTAIETLYNAGIQADFYAATERIPQLRNTLRYLPDPKYLDKVMLLASDVIHPSTVELFKHCCIFSKADEPFFWLMMLFNRDEAYRWRPVYLMNPLVGNLGLSAALNLGFKQVYLFGVDNGRKLGTAAYHPELSGIYRETFKRILQTVNTKIQMLQELDPTIPDMPWPQESNIDADGRALSDEEKVQRTESYIEKFHAYIKAVNKQIHTLQESGHPELTLFYEAKPISPAEVVPGNFGGEIHCNGMYRLARRNMELICEFYKESCVFNCSDGAKLEHTQSVHSEDVAAQFANLPAVDKASLLGAIERDMTFNIAFTREDFAKLSDADAFDAIIERLHQHLATRGATRLEFTQRLESHAELIADITHHLNRFIGFLLDGSMNTFFILMLRALYQSADEEQGLRFANAIADIYQKFLEDAGKLYRFLPDYCIGQHQKFTDYKIGYDHGNDKAPNSPPLQEVITEETLAQVKRTPFVKRYS